VSLGGIASVLIGVDDMNASLRLFRDGMGLTVEDDGNVSDERKAFWGLDGTCTDR
jgi:catechol 2,3-dioxygenase-like lactoylglutathione lyase family enzyme